MDTESSEIQERVRKIKSLPTLPGIVKRLCSMVESDDSSVSEVADIIATDQVLTAKVLKIVNSSFYGFPGRISTINHALVLLGFHVVKGIILSAAVIDYMSDRIVGMWEHSVGVATAADRIARKMGVPDPEEISTAGLLHDLGKVILSVELRHDCEAVLDEVETAGVSFIEAERRCLDGLTHCEIAGWLAEDWNLPPRLREPLVLHHNPSMALHAPVPTAIVHLSNILVRALQFGSGGDPYVPPIDPDALKTLGLRMGDLAGLLELIDDELEGLDTSEFL